MACMCKECVHCNGTGDVWFSPSGKFLDGNNRDDLSKLEPCPFCNGTGIEEMCDECYEQMCEDEMSEMEG